MARSTRTGGQGADKHRASVSETSNTDPAIENLQDVETAPKEGDEIDYRQMNPVPDPEILPPGRPADAVPQAQGAVEDAVEVQPDAVSDTRNDDLAAADEPQIGPPLTDQAQNEPESSARDDSQTVPPLAPPPRPVRPSFVPMVLGGAVAAMLGYAAAWTDILPRPPDPVLSSRVDTLASAQAAQDARLTGVATGLDEFASRPAEDSDARGRIDEATERFMAETAEVRALFGQVESRIEGLGGELVALADRLTALEDRPQVTVALSDAAQAAVEADIAALRRDAAESIARVEADREALGAQLAERFDGLQGELRTALAAIEAEQDLLQVARAEAAADADADRLVAVSASLRAALDAGGPYSEPLQTLVDLAGTTPPAALTDYAADGVPTLASLREGFSDAARAALEAAIRAQIASGELNRVEGFMRIHSGVRSLTPQDGDSPDAVLSRAEAALADADIAGALALVDELPPEGRTAMQAWVDQAETRRAALAALDALSGS